MTRRLTMFLSLALAACATAPHKTEQAEAAPAPVVRYSAESGTMPVGVIPDATLRDTQRGRDVTLTIDYPIGTGTHPLIIFSHGYASNGHAYVGLSSHWASYGYVVIKPTHLLDQNVKLIDLTAADFRDRVADIKFVLDNLDALQKRYPELQGKIDTAKIGVGGHSLGALTAMLIGGVRTFPGPVSYADSRVKAVIAMSPQGPRESWGLTKDSWSDVHVPVMYMTGDRDKGIDDSETPDWRRQAFELSATGDKWLVFIAGAGHLAFTGRLGVMPEPEPRPTMIDPNDPFATRDTLDQQHRRTQSFIDPIRAVSGTIKSVSLAFWDAYLNADAKGREFLDKAGERTGVEVKKK